jgi:shikimate dehydrogenase
MSLLAGLIGNPIAHSRSPALHNAAFRACNLAAHYELWPTLPENLAERITGLRADYVLGANVTLPFKQMVMPFLDRIDPLASAIGAVNTIIREADGSLTGTNTDAEGFLRDLHEHPYEPANQHVVIIGASGAARAAAAVLLQSGVHTLTIINRTIERAETLLADLIDFAPNEPRLFSLSSDDPTSIEQIAAASLLVNATSLGWKEDEIPIDIVGVHDKMLVYDMVYRSTRLLREAAGQGAQTRHGAGMLIYQAALAFERWTGQSAPISVMREAFAKA